jgi:peptidoglycan/LPS O-acetylase OafA/YrhL
MDREVRSLTGLRGVAACAVVAYHYLGRIDGVAPPSLPVLLRGYLAVDLFFVLSGFVMALSSARQFSAGFDASAYRSFLLRRLARIYPLYVAVLAVFVMAIDCGVAPDLTLWNCAGMIVGNLLLLQTTGAALSLNAPSWSISAEFAAYLLFPVLVQATLVGSPRRAVSVAVGAAALLVVASLLGPLLQHVQRGPLDLYDETTRLPLLRCLAGFSFGLLAYRAARVAWVTRIAARDDAAVGVILALAAGLWWVRNDLLIYPLLPLLVLCLYANRGWIAGVMGCAAMHRLGVWSYAIYLLHAALLWVISATLPMPGWSSVVALVGSLLVLAPLAQYGIELPGRRLIRGWGGRAREVVVA